MDCSFGRADMEGGKVSDIGRLSGVFGLSNMGWPADVEGWAGS